VNIEAISPNASVGHTLHHHRRVAAVLFIGWLTSLALPAIGYSVDSDGTPVEGIIVLFGGWILAFSWLTHPNAYPAHLGWLANPAFIIAVVLMVGRLDRSRLFALKICGGLLLLFSVVTLDLLLRPLAEPYEIHLKVFAEPFHYSTNGVAIGYYVWLVTNITAAIAALTFRTTMQDQ
jgi:hypothetical protein